MMPSRHRTTFVLLPALLGLLAAAGMLAGCANSILRNAAEAGIETALDRPLPPATPSPAGSTGVKGR